MSIPNPEQITRVHLQWLKDVGSHTSPNEFRREQLTIKALEGCRRACEILAQRLKVMGYPVEDVFVPPVDTLDNQLDELEAKIGPVPPVLRLFWQYIGGLQFVRLEDYAHVDFWDRLGVYGSREYCDGLYIERGDADWLEHTYATFEERQEWDEDERQMFPFTYILAPDGFHKDDISGGSPYGLRPSTSWVAEVEDFQWPKNTAPISAAQPPDFLSYLRTTILECAGFPGLYGEPAFEPYRLRLLEGLEIF